MPRYRNDLLEIMIDFYSNLNSTDKLKVKIEEFFPKLQLELLFGSVHNGNVKLSKFFFGLFIKSQIKLGCWQILMIVDETARFEIAEIFHSESLLYCSKDTFEFIVSRGEENFVDWLVVHEYTGQDKRFTLAGVMKNWFT